MTEQAYIESLLQQIDHLKENDLKLRRANSKLKKSERHLKRVIRGYKEKLETKEKRFYKNGRRGTKFNG